MALFNFRDLGGIKNRSGRSVKNGLFYRGGPLIDLNDSEKEFVDKLSLKTILDLRSQREIERTEADYNPSGCYYVHIGASKLLHETRKDDLDMTRPTSDAIEEWLKKQYRDLAFDNPAYKFLFKAIEEEELPVYFHCSAGKDRTGVGAALILYFLDVDKEEIYKDYLRSYDEMLKLDIPHTRPSLVFREWLEGTFQEIDKRYGDRNKYFFEEFGIDFQQRRKMVEKYTVDSQESYYEKSTPDS